MAAFLLRRRAAKNTAVILRAMSDNTDESGYEVPVVKKFSIADYVKTATDIVTEMLKTI